MCVINEARLPACDDLSKRDERQKNWDLELQPLNVKEICTL